MEGRKLDKRQFGWLNDNDSFLIFTEEMRERYSQIKDNDVFNLDLDGWAEYLNEQLFMVYQHLLVTPKNALYGFDGFSYVLIADNLQDIYETALSIP